MLDGGQIVLSCLESVFPRFKQLRLALTVLGITLLAALMLYANAQDAARYWVAWM